MSVALGDHDGTANFCIYSDPGMKLFGRGVPLKQEASEEPSTISTVQLSSHQDDQAESVFQMMECKEPMDISILKPGNRSCLEDGSNLGSTSVKMGDCSDTHDTLQKSEEVQGTVTLEKTTKKPDKLLPCPRCNSLDTKFCYFNNYNVNQPRHFCRKCQRYWTAGGTLRNVPVGAGRRKNKHSALHQKHAIISEASVVRTIPGEVARHRFGSISVNTGASLGSSCKPRLHAVPSDAPSVPTSDSPATNNSMLAFGQESPLCRGMAATSLGMQEMTTLQNQEDVCVEVSMPADVTFAAGEGVKIIPPSCQANGSLSHPSSAVQLQQDQLTKNTVSKSHQMQVGEVTPPTVHGGIWQPGSNMMSMNPFSFAASPSPDGENIATSSFPFPPPNSLPSCNGAAGSFWPGFPWPFMTPVMWGAPPSLEWAGPWTLPIYSSGAAAVAAAAAASGLPHPIAGTSPSKHQAMERSQPEKCLWVPKTLRIDDPLNAARSSIWTTLGLEDGPQSSPALESTNAFQAKSVSKDDKENTVISTNRLSNPAALLRSAVFQENS